MLERFCIRAVPTINSLFHQVVAYLPSTITILYIMRFRRGRRNVAAAVAAAAVLFCNIYYAYQSLDDALWQTSITGDRHRTAFRVHKTLLDPPGHWAETVWRDLLAEAAALSTASSGGTTAYTAMEVGMHRAAQCLEIAQSGLDAHCLEPSPSSFERIRNRVAGHPLKAKIHLHQAAASDKDGEIRFSGSGGTGDHVGPALDIWNMRAAPPPTNEDSAGAVSVPTIRLDTLILNREQPIDNLFVLKIDTQGHEAAVIDGLSETLRQHRVQFVLMEFWPAGMALMTGQPLDSCATALRVLAALDAAGFTIYTMGASSHPKSPKEAKDYLKQTEAWPEEPEAYCRYFHSVAEKFPSHDYKMGYWADILAVAPPLPWEQPTTELGRLLTAHQRRQQQPQPN